MASLINKRGRGKMTKEKEKAGKGIYKGKDVREC
jgi:hypothetical protein